MINIYGAPRDAAKLAYWACCEYGLEDYDFDLLFDFTTMDNGDHGELTDYSMKDIVPNFTVTIEADLTGRDLAIAIFHELCHVQQVLDGRFEFEDGPPYWLGKRFKYKPNMMYSELPWEIEAFESEQILYNKYLQSEENVLDLVS